MNSCANFNTYVINLEQDYSNFIDIQNNLKSLKYDQVFRFEAINGSSYIKNNNHTYDDYITPFCRKFCTHSIIGIGLSHLLLAEHIYYNDLYEYSLILENDVIPILQNIKNNDFNNEHSY